jgi:hypothetical protein
MNSIIEEFPSSWRRKARRTFGLPQRLESDFVALATQTGFRLVRTMRLALSKMMGTRKRGESFKYEPIYVFQKEI